MELLKKVNWKMQIWNLFEFTVIKKYIIHHVEIVPVNIADMANSAKSLFRVGAITPKHPICIPIEATLANPQSANVKRVNAKY